MRFMSNPLIAEYIPRKDHIHVPVHGEFDLASAIKIFERIFDTCQVSGINRVLLDTRQMQGTISATERIVQGLSLENPYQAYRSAGCKPIRLAILSTKDRLTPYHPLSDTLSQLDLATSAFTDPAKVLGWLGIESIEDTGAEPDTH